MKILIKYYLALHLFVAVSVGRKCKCTCENETENTTERNTTEEKMEGLIVGGNFTEISKFPHSVAMLAYPTINYFCSGSVLNQKIVLTAAHCVPHKLFKKFQVYVMAGHGNLEQMPIVRNVRHYISHADYSQETVANDIALLFLEVPLQLGPTVQRVVITREFPLNVTTGHVSGWGTINDTTKEHSLILKYTSQPIIPLDECKTTYEEDWVPGLLCAGDPNNKIDRPSRGDSGAALVVSGYHQIGLVSFRNPYLPGVIYYTNISDFYVWIAAQTLYHVCENVTKPGTSVEDEPVVDTGIVSIVVDPVGDTDDPSIGIDPAVDTGIASIEVDSVGHTDIPSTGVKPLVVPLEVDRIVDTGIVSLEVEPVVYTDAVSLEVDPVVETNVASAAVDTVNDTDVNVT